MTTSPKSKSLKNTNDEFAVAAHALLVNLRGRQLVLSPQPYNKNVMATIHPRGGGAGLSLLRRMPAPTSGSAADED